MAVADAQPKLFQFQGHTWAAMAAQRQTILFSDMGQDTHVLALAVAEMTAALCSKPVRADILDPA